MKKLVLSAAVLAIFTGGMTAAVTVAAPGTAIACPIGSQKSTDLASKLPQVKYRDHGRHVLALQLALRDEGYTYLKGTGNYAGETLRAVKDYQRKHHIKASGIVGSKTWQALVGTKSKAFTGGTLEVVEAFSLNPGERNEEKLNTLYNMLQRIYPYLTEWAPAANTDPYVYGPDLQKMVRDFQKRAGIKASGIVGPKTVSAMNEAIAVAGHWGC
jgi:peptidoglycan hydrolase-like protein with peptidoglycan-binding domain